MLPHARHAESVGGGAHGYHDSVVGQLKFVNGTLTPPRRPRPRTLRLFLSVSIAVAVASTYASVLVQAADRLRDGAVLHRPDRGASQHRRE